MDELDRRLLNLLQWDFPLVPEPFKAIEEKLGIPQEEVMSRIKRLKEEGIIREISAIFDTRRLAYKSALVAMKVPPDRIDEVGEAVSQHPGVSHNYKRDHEFNLWFTLAVPPNRSLEEELAQLAKKVGVEDYRLLPTKKLFKIGVKLDMLQDDPEEPKPDPNYSFTPRDRIRPLDERDKAIIREVQRDLEIIERPFLQIALRLGMREEDLIATLKEYERRGIMRRFAAVLRHRKAGFVANGMACWKVPQEKVYEFGRLAASFPQISHCYERPTYEDWPYNLYTMIHARSREAVEKVAKELSRRSGIDNYIILYGTKEYKKERVRYFVD